MKKFFIILTVLVLGAIAYIVYYQINTREVSSAPTRTNLEAAYNKVRVAIVAKDQTAFEDNIESAKPGAKIPEDKWQEGLIYIDALYPDLGATKFITIMDKGEFAYYITQTELNDSTHINVTSFKFHKIGGSWKLVGTSNAQSLLKGSTSTEDEAVLQRAVDAIIAEIK